MLLPILLFDAYGLGIAQERDPEEGRTVTNLGRSPSEIKSSHQSRSSLVLITSWKWILIVNHLESIPPAQPVALTTVRYICKALLTPGDEFLITDDALTSTETCLEIKSEGEMLEGTYKQSIILHQAELSRERLEILRSGPNDLNRHI